ncbi:CPBP family intramembrane glutamic endopeptidase [Streptomyces aureus]|uniref:CPBP family intramembrane glutamic endopeptidase n=1 Tax=Streptomyces aureus TaxID=193461 RepID=UPI0033FD9A8E
MATVAPAELVRIAGSFHSTPARDNRNRTRATAAVGVPAAYLVVTGLAVAVVASGHLTPDRLNARPAEPSWLLAAIGIGVALVAAEYTLGAVPQLVRGARSLRLSVQAPAGPGQLVSILLTAMAEELLYRGLWIGTLEQGLHLPTWLAICCAAVGYALGHLFFGGIAVLQKSLSGVVYGLLLIASGSLLAPVLAHLGQNLTVHALAVRQGRCR